MPGTTRELWSLLYGEFSGTRVSSTYAAVEEVSGYIGVRQPGSAMFRFGASYGELRMALVALGIPFRVVRPQAWQKALDIPPRKRSESKTAWKNRLAAEARRRFPTSRITLATADAVLLADYARQTYKESTNATTT
jgi:hypothetical protein